MAWKEAGPAVGTPTHRLGRLDPWAWFLRTDIPGEEERRWGGELEEAPTRASSSGPAGDVGVRPQGRAPVGQLPESMREGGVLVADPKPGHR